MKNKLIANLLEQRDGEIYGAVRREMERTFGDYSRNWLFMKELSRQGLRFNVDVTESDGAVEVKADIPGVDAKNIEVQLKDNTLIIKGEKKEEKEEKKKEYHISERTYGSFFRSFALPAEVDDTKIDATFANGTLHIHLPKSYTSKNGSKTIPVKPA